MDLRDWSMGVSRDGGGGDDGILSVNSSLAKEALSLFQCEKFVECVEVLNPLLRNKENDPKILHNIAVAEFLRDGCSDPKRLLEVLVNVKRKSEDLARASKEQAELAAQDKVIPGTKITNNLANNSIVVFSDEFDASVAALNIATVLFHLHEYPKALSVLEPLFQNIEPIDETTALHVCLLLLDVAFSTQDASKFSDVISYLEKTFGVSYQQNHGNDATSIGEQQQISNLVRKSSSDPNHSSPTDDLNTEGIAAGTASEISLSRTLSDETIEYENLLSTLGISGKNITRPSNLSPKNDISRTPVDFSTPRVNLKLQLPLYKIQLLLLTRNLKAAKREVKLAMNIARGIDPSRALMLKSQLEYARGNYPKAFKLLKASSNQDDDGSSIIINNNIGCIYYHQGQHHISSIFFHKAFSKCSSLWKENPKKLATFSQDKSLLISYNCGVQYLSCGKPVHAARCLLKASLVFYNRPLLWLRLSECCIMAWEMGLLKNDETPSQESDFLRVQVIGRGKWRQLAMQNGPCSDDGVHSVLDYIKPKLSLSFARQCLHNALHLLGCFELKHVKWGSLSRSPPEESSKNLGHNNIGNTDPKSNSPSSGRVSANGDAREHRGGAHGNTSAASAMSEYEEICRRENQRIKQAILTDLAFVELELGNPLKALSAALSLLKLPDCSKMHAFLGHVYAAEALCLLNKVKEAAEHLSSYLPSGRSNADLPYTQEDCRQWQSRKTGDADDSYSAQIRVPAYVERLDNVFLAPEEARGSLYVNLASMFVIQGDLEQASRYAKQALTIMPLNQEAVLMAIYLDLKLGKAAEALTKLKRCCRVRFFPLSWRSKAASC